MGLAWHPALTAVGVQALSTRADIEIVEHRSGMRAAELGASVRWGTTGLLLDGIKLGDPAEGLFSDGGALRLMDVDELAPHLEATAAAGPPMLIRIECDPDAPPMLRR